MCTTKNITIFETLRATARESNARVASKEVSDNTVRREREPESDVNGPHVSRGEGGATLPGAAQKEASPQYAPHVWPVTASCARKPAEAIMPRRPCDSSRLLHEAQVLIVARREVEGVKVEVARVVVWAEGGGRLARLGVHLGPPHADAVELCVADADGHDDPQPEGQLGDLVNGRAAVAGEERVEALLHEEAGRREHADAAVRQLRLAQPVDLALALALEEAGGIEVAEDVVAAGQAERKLVGERVLLGGLLAHRDGHARRHLGGCG